VQVLFLRLHSVHFNEPRTQRHSVAGETEDANPLAQRRQQREVNGGEAPMDRPAIAAWPVGPAEGGSGEKEGIGEE